MDYTVTSPRGTAPKARSCIIHTVCDCLDSSPVEKEKGGQANIVQLNVMGNIPRWTVYSISHARLKECTTLCKHKI